MSVAQNILYIVQQHLPERQMHQASSIRLRIGEAAGIVPESLEFCFKAITSDSPLRSTSLIIERIPLQLHCNLCNTNSISDSEFFLCQHCGAGDINILSGTELQVVEIEVNNCEEVAS